MSVERRRRLSDGQVRLWFLHRLNDDTPLYTEHLCIRLQGSLNVSAVHQALAHIVRRHESLRWVIREEGASCAAVVGDDAPAVCFGPIDLCGIDDEQERERIYRRCATEALRRPFDLAAGPLFRVLLFRCAPSEFAIAVAIHHIISDSWSTRILVDDFCRAYRAIVSGAPVGCEELDYGSGMTPATGSDEQLQYWTAKLANAPVPVSLPSHRRRPEKRTFRGAKQHFVFDESTSAAMRDRVREERITPFILLLAIWTAYLGAVTGSRDLVVGTTTAGRGRKGTERLIGFFVNTLAVRTDFRLSQSFRHYLRHVRSVTLEALDHQDVPFDRVVRALHLRRTSNVQPLFEVMCIYLSASVNELVLPGVDVRLASDEIASGLCKFDIVLSFAESGPTIRGTIDYSVELYDAHEIRSHVARFRRFAQRVLLEPDRRIADLIPMERPPLPVVQDLRSSPSVL